MMMRLFRYATVLFAPCAPWSGAAAQISMQVEITGAVQRPLRLDAAGLAASEAQQIVTFVQTRSTGRSITVRLDHVDGVLCAAK